MNLDITDPEAERLAREIARVTGQSVSDVVTDALRERHSRMGTPETRASVEELLEIAGRVAARLRGPVIDHGELLYDERGLPK